MLSKIIALVSPILLLGRVPFSLLKQEMSGEQNSTEWQYLQNIWSNDR